MDPSVEKSQHTTSSTSAQPVPTEPAAERTRDDVQYEAGYTERICDRI